MGGEKMSGGIEVIAFQKDKTHISHSSPAVLSFTALSDTFCRLWMYLYLQTYSLFIFSEATAPRKWFWNLTFGEPSRLPGSNLCSISVEKRGPWCPGAAISFPAVTFLTGCLQDTGTQSEPHAASSWQKARTPRCGHTVFVGLFCLTLNAGAKLQRKPKDRFE